MVSKRFLVEHYQVALGYKLSGVAQGQKVTFRGYIVCYGSDHTFALYFLTDDSFVPNPSYKPDYKRGTIYLPHSEFMRYIDLVRNEKPIYAYLNEENPEWNSLKTAKEPVGEEEE